MKRPIDLIFAAICVYAPHLVEEYFTRMYDDPIIAFALGLVGDWSPRHAAYFVFQAMLMVTLLTALAVAAGARTQNIVLAVLAVSLVGEAHHVVRFLISPHYNSGLVTALPMPIVGILIFRKLFTKEKIACSTTSSSPWASGASRSA